jgi:hypothetical protein
MAESKLTREEIALRILCAAISTCPTEGPSQALSGIGADLYTMAFKAAKLFIEERDKKI